MIVDRNFWRLAVLGGMAAMLAVPAAAQEVVRGKKAGDLVLGFGLIGVLPEEGGKVDGIGGKPSAGNAVTPQLDITWFMTDYLALNLIAATTRHEVEVKNSALGDVDLGRVWALPPTLTLQLHPLPQSRISPYAGVGVNYTIFYAEGGRTASVVNHVNVEQAFGWALNAGVDYELSPGWLANVDVKKLFLRPDVSVNHGNIEARADLDPWIIGAAIRYRF